MSSVEQITIGVYLLGAFIGLFGFAFALYAARPFSPPTKHEDRPDVPAE